MPLFRSIQALRALAALAVLLFHAAQRAGGGFTVGAAGVDVFFVISGFIMWSVTAAEPRPPERRATAARFITQRLIRIVPLYWAVTLAMAALAQWPGVFPNLATPFRHVALSLLFIPHADPAGGNFPLLAAGWTLNDEMLFYLIFAAALRTSRRTRLLAVSGALLALVTAGWLWRPTSPWLQSYTDPVLLEFGAGAWLAAHRTHLPPSWAGWLVALGAGALAVQAWWPGAGAQWRLLAWGLPALLLVAAAVSWDMKTSWPSRALFALGDASYGIYLLHGLVVSACWRLLHAAPVAVFLLACVVISAVAGLCSFGLLERPLTRSLRRALLEPARSRAKTNMKQEKVFNHEAHEEHERSK